MSTSHGIKFTLRDEHLVLLLRDADGVSIVPPRETEYSVRLERTALDGTPRGARDYASVDDFIDGVWTESDELIR
ncbi:MAG: hypothetical protein JNL82_24745 [Myxococcales bacterium]|nr:hypothetical protein [Myxococcales bacterium]